MKIEKVTVRAGRCVPHPLYDFENLKADLEIVASVEADEDPEEVRKQLHAKIESDIEQHVADLKDGIRDLEKRHESRRRIEQLEKEVLARTEQLEAIRERLGDMPLLAPLSDVRK